MACERGNCQLFTVYNDRGEGTRCLECNEVIWDVEDEKSEN